ncbi:MAG: archaellin/type IV pilin N-terminal domain-containing protein [Thermoplasmata archaeon]
MLKKERGVSAVIGVILVVAITVVASATAYLYIGRYISGSPNAHPLLVDVSTYSNVNGSVVWSVYQLTAGSIVPPAVFRLVNSTTGGVIAWWPVLGIPFGYGFNSLASVSSNYGPGPLYAYLVLFNNTRTGDLRPGDSFDIVLSTVNLTNASAPTSSPGGLPVEPFLLRNNGNSSNSGVINEGIISSWSLQIMEGNSLVYNAPLGSGAGNSGSFSLSILPGMGGLIGSGVLSSTPSSSGSKQYIQYITATLQLSQMLYDLPSGISPFAMRSGSSPSILYNVSITVSNNIYYKNIVITSYRSMYSFTVSPSLSNGSYTLSVSVLPLSGQDFFSVGGAHFSGSAYSPGYTVMVFSPNASSTPPYTSSAGLAVKGNGHYYVSILAEGAISDFYISTGSGSYAVTLDLKSLTSQNEYTQTLTVGSGVSGWLNFTVYQGNYNVTLFIQPLDNSPMPTVSSSLSFRELSPTDYYAYLYISSWSINSITLGGNYK